MSYTRQSASSPKRASRRIPGQPLTTEAIAAARSKSAPYELPDRDGLYLWVTPTAGKLWRWNYPLDGQIRIMPYGEWPKISLERARAEHRKARRYLLSGVDPMTAKRAAEKHAKYLRIARQEERSVLAAAQLDHSDAAPASPPGRMAALQRLFTAKETAGDLASRRSILSDS